MILRVNTIIFQCLCSKDIFFYIYTTQKNEIETKPNSIYYIYARASNKFNLKFMSPGHEYKLLSPSGVKSP